MPKRKVAKRRNVVARKQKVLTSMSPFGKQYGTGFFGSLWKGVKTVASPLYGLARKTKLVSKLLKNSSNPKAKTAGEILGAIGLGRRRIMYQRRIGSGLTPSGGGKYRGRPRKVGRPTKTRTKKHVNPRTARKKTGSGLRLAGSGKITKKTVFP